MKQSSCSEKHSLVKRKFDKCPTPDGVYKTIIELGKTIQPLDSIYKTDENLVSGCQSLLYLRGFLKDGKIYFEAQSDALISAGLAALLLEAYNGEPPEALFLHPPLFLEELQISTNLLTPGRSNGLASLWQKMKVIAIKFIKQSN